MLQKNGFFVALIFFLEGLALVLFALYLWWVNLSWLFLWMETLPDKTIGWLFLSLQFSSALLELGFMTRLKNQPRLVFLLTCFFVASISINAVSIINFLLETHAFPEIAGKAPFVVITSTNGQSYFVVIAVLLVALLTYMPKLLWDGGKMTSDGWSQLRLCLKPAQDLGSVKE
jgi:hypothetical protein